MKKSISLLITLMLSVVWLAGFAPASAQSPRVIAVLFFSPGCGHCQKVLTEDLPPLQEKYSDQLQIYMVDTSSDEGHALFESAIEHYKVPAERIGVPMLVAGGAVLVGSQEIPQQFPAMIDSALAENGLELPDIPDLNVAKLPLFAATGQVSEEEVQQPKATLPPVQTVSPVEQGDLQPEQSNRSPFINKFMQDPTGNSLAVILLVLIAIAIIWAIWSFLTKSHVESTRRSGWAVPTLTIAGIFVAAYMTYIEITHTQAICGPIGNCNAVQQSSYAVVLGILPVGLLGIAGYILILASWIFYRRGPARWQNITALLCWGLVWFGVFFSFYLTFIEAFVIGATCAWCITSATIMMLLLLATTGPAINAWNPEE
jgi:uncharacterized membrane protein/thiol-disulfide isomerase/thioredoxin